MPTHWCLHELHMCRPRAPAQPSACMRGCAEAANLPARCGAAESTRTRRRGRLRRLGDGSTSEGVSGNRSNTACTRGCRRVLVEDNRLRDFVPVEAQHRRRRLAPGRAPFSGPEGDPRRTAPSGRRASGRCGRVRVRRARSVRRSSGRLQRARLLALSMADDDGLQEPAGTRGRGRAGSAGAVRRFISWSGRCHRKSWLRSRRVDRECRRLPTGARCSAARPGTATRYLYSPRSNPASADFEAAPRRPVRRTRWSRPSTHLRRRWSGTGESSCSERRGGRQRSELLASAGKGGCSRPRSGCNARSATARLHSRSRGEIVGARFGMASAGSSRWSRYSSSTTSGPR